MQQDLLGVEVTVQPKWGIEKFKDKYTGRVGVVSHVSEVDTANHRIEFKDGTGQWFTRDEIEVSDKGSAEFAEEQRGWIILEASDIGQDRGVVLHSTGEIVVTYFNTMIEMHLEGFTLTEVEEIHDAAILGS